MADYTKYPNQIDTTTELPKATDLVTPVKAEVVNRLRDAIMAIENELGVQPSSTYSTVRARLDYFDGWISSLASEIDTLTNRVEDLELSGGGGGGDGIVSKARVYVTIAQAGGAVTVPATVTWGSDSTLITGVRATTESTTIGPSISGSYLITGQLTIAPTVDSISGITVEVMKNGTVIHTHQDRGAVWSVGSERALPFSFLTDLEADDELSVAWTHSGSASSTTELVNGDEYSWFAFSRVAGLE